jgi:hypothetical protein
MHGTFAPLYSSGIFSSPPLPGSKVRLHYFQSPMVSSGEPIAGFYEKMYDDDIFEEACSEIAKLLSVFRAAFEKAAKIVTPTKSNIPTVAAATSAPPAEGTVGSPVGPTTTAPELVGDLGSVSDSRWPPRDLVTQFIGDPAAPSRQLYDTVIDQFQVETNPRYTPRKLYPSDEKQATFCNIFAADVTWAMGLPLPQKIDANGDPQPMSEPLKKGGTTQGCTLMLRWLRGRGKAYEWKEVSEKEAQENANKGLVTVACAKKHISVVRPAKSGEKEVPVCAQAGARVVNYRPVSKCFIYKEFTRKDGSVEPADPPYFFTCFRKTRYTNPTKEQLDSLSAQTSIEQQSIEQTSASSVGTEEQQSTTSQ